MLWLFVILTMNFVTVVAVLVRFCCCCCYSAVVMTPVIAAVVTVVVIVDSMLCYNNKGLFLTQVLRSVQVTHWFALKCECSARALQKRGITKKNKATTRTFSLNSTYVLSLIYLCSLSSLLSLLPFCIFTFDTDMRAVTSFMREAKGKFTRIATVLTGTLLAVFTTRNRNNK